MTGWYNSSWRARFLEYRKEGDGWSHPLLLCDKTHRRRTMMSGDDRQNSPSISRQNRPSATQLFHLCIKSADYICHPFLIILRFSVRSPDKGNLPLRGAECLCIFIFQRCDIRFKKARAHLSDQIIQRKSGTGKRIGCHHNPLLI